MAVIIAATVVTTITSLSMSAISTNGVIKGGELLTANISYLDLNYCLMPVTLFRRMNLKITIETKNWENHEIM